MGLVFLVLQHAVLMKTFVNHLTLLVPDAALDLG